MGRDKEDKMPVAIHDVLKSDQISKSSTILIGLKQCLGKTIHRGMKVMIAGFGVGLSWAGTMLKF